MTKNPWFIHSFSACVRNNFHMFSPNQPCLCQGRHASSQNMSLGENETTLCHGDQAERSEIAEKASLKTSRWSQGSRMCRETEMSLDEDNKAQLSAHQKTLISRHSSYCVAYKLPETCLQRSSRTTCDIHTKQNLWCSRPLLIAMTRGGVNGAAVSVCNGSMKTVIHQQRLFKCCHCILSRGAMCPRGCFLANETEVLKKNE